MEQDENGDVNESVWILVEELNCVFDHVALEFDLVGVHAQHHEQY